MPTDQAILDLATDLGKLIADHDATKKLASATKAFEADPASKRDMAEYQRFAQSLQEKAQAGGAIEVDDKRKLETLQQAVITNPLLANMQRAEMDYLDLLRKVDAAIVSASPAAGSAPGSPPPAAASPILGG